MRPFENCYVWLEHRYSKRALSRAVVVLFLTLLATQLLLVWYFGSVGLSLSEMGYAEDERTVVLDAEDHAKFERDYHPDREEGWCLYGSMNETQIRVEAVAHADPLSQSADRIDFTCAGETADRFVAGENPRLLGTVHSHPTKTHSRLSRVDMMTWGRTSPVVKMMGVYTEESGVEFYTVSSMIEPLEKDVREPDAQPRHVSVSNTQSTTFT